MARVEIFQTASNSHRISPCQGAGGSTGKGPRCRRRGGVRRDFSAAGGPSMARMAARRTDVGGHGHQQGEAATRLAPTHSSADTLAALRLPCEGGVTLA